ncbi:hypothetical protein BX666DRAFT_1878486 [Dichotomocladium elegans]|nr:hypothetical protein BX666DRAFT_1878486 [Dichotomocladium elegans]
MVYIVGENGGHRSTRCDHKHRVLVEIKRKGRPLSQCDNCRALRKTKRVHIKCKCPESPSVSVRRIAASGNDPGQPDSVGSGASAVQGQNSGDTRLLIINRL